MRAPLGSEMAFSRHALSPLMLLAVLFVSAAAPHSAQAHGRVFVGIGPVYPYPYPYYYPPAVAYPVAPPAAVVPDVPPPGWAPGHWERHHDRAGRPYDLWVPPHLR